LHHFTEERRKVRKNSAFFDVRKNTAICQCKKESSNVSLFLLLFE